MGSSENQLLHGWKEISDHLNCTTRTAQRWERFGLPVHHVSGRNHSPVIAISNEIHAWVQRRGVTANFSSLASTVMEYRATRRRTLELVEQVKALRMEQKRLLASFSRKELPEQPANGKAP